MRGRKLVRVHGKQNGSEDGGRGGEGGGRGGETERRRMKDERRRQRRRGGKRGKGTKKKKNKKIDLLIKLYFSTMKVLAQRPTHISAIVTVLLIIKTFSEIL